MEGAWNLGFWRVESETLPFNFVSRGNFTPTRPRRLGAETTPATITKILVTGPWPRLAQNSRPHAVPAFIFRSFFSRFSSAFSFSTGDIRNGRLIVSAPSCFLGEKTIRLFAIKVPRSEFHFCAR